mgnify:CR=1 FL=1
MSDSDTTMAIITNLFSGFGGVCVGALITYLLQEKSAIKKKKTEILNEILKRGYNGSELLFIVAQATMIFQSQNIDTHLNEIIKIYSSRGEYLTENEKKLNNKFRALAISMRDNIEISNEVLTDEFIEKTIAAHSYRP